MKDYSINTDAIFLQGSTHQVCEDYATNFGSKEGSNRIIVCDGCSGSSMTDVGARLLALETSQAIAQNLSISDTFKFIEWLIKNNYNNFLEANPFMLDATLLFSYETENSIKTIMYGDGVAFFKFKNGNYLIFNREFKNSYPYYFSYNLDEKRKESYLSLGERNKTTVYNSDEDASYIIDNDSDYFGINYHIEHTQLEMVLLLSDGIHSFYKTDENGKKVEDIGYMEMMKKVIDFKNFHGVFVQRQIKALMKRLKKENIFHYDDFSVAGLYIKEEE